jgi:hypothetical protein
MLEVMLAIWSGDTCFPNSTTPAHACRHGELIADLAAPGRNIITRPASLREAPRVIAPLAIDIGYALPGRDNAATRMAWLSQDPSDSGKGRHFEAISGTAIPGTRTVVHTW